MNALRTRATAAGDEIARLAAAATAARERSAAAQAELERVQGEVGALDEGELGLDERHEAAVAARDTIDARVDELAAAEREAERERSTWSARAEALASSLTRKDGGAALLAAGDRLPGVRGSVAALLTVEPGYETRGRRRAGRGRRRHRRRLARGGAGRADAAQGRGRRPGRPARRRCRTARPSVAALPRRSAPGR